jgi:hypothetical protein
MKIFSVFGSTQQVLRRLNLFLTENRFSRIRIDHLSNEITAERKRFLLWKDYIHIRVSTAQENIANIELKVNPIHLDPTGSDEMKEAELQKKLYLYF